MSSSMEIATIRPGPFIFGAAQSATAISWGPGPASASADAKPGQPGTKGKATKLARPRGGKRPLRRIAIELDQLEVEVKAKLDELQKAESEHQRLANRLKVLETVIPVRERELNFLCQQQAQQATRVCAPAVAPAVALPALPAPPRIVELPPSLPGSPCDSLDVDALLFTHDDLSADIFEVPPIVDSPTDTEAAAGSGSSSPAAPAAQQQPREQTDQHQRQQQQQQPTSSVSSGGDANGDKCAPMLEPMYSGGSAAFSAPTLRELADERSARALASFRDLWSNWLRDAGLLLHSHDARPQDPGPELKLLRMRQQLMPKMHALRQEYPCLSKDVFMYNLETGEREGAPVSHWVAVARSMALKPDQLAACLAALTMYRERAAPALAQRQRLASEVVAGLRAVCGGGGGGGGGGRGGAVDAAAGGGKAGAAAAAAAPPPQQQPVAAEAGAPAEAVAASEAVLRLCAGTEELSRNISAEGQAIDIVKDFLSNGVMSVVQLARIAVLSYPWFPDALALLTTLEEAHLQQQQQQAEQQAAAAAEVVAAAATTAC